MGTDGQKEKKEGEKKKKLVKVLKENSSSLAVKV